jgi:hypothetical protein
MMVGPNCMVNMSLNLHLSSNSKFGFKIIKNTRKTENKIKKKRKWKIENSTWVKSSTTRSTYLIRPRSPTPSLRRRQTGPPRQAHSRTDRTLTRAPLAPGHRHWHVGLTLVSLKTRHTHSPPGGPHTPESPLSSQSKQRLPGRPPKPSLPDPDLLGLGSRGRIPS